MILLVIFYAAEKSDGNRNWLNWWLFSARRISWSSVFPCVFSIWKCGHIFSEYLKLTTKRLWKKLLKRQMPEITRRQHREEEEDEEEVVFTKKNGDGVGDDDEGGVRLRIKRWDAEEMILD